MNLSHFQDDTLVADRTLIVNEVLGQVDLPTAHGDWSKNSEIRAEVFLPEGVDGQIVCSVTSGHRSEGMSEDDGYRFNAIVSPRGGNIWSGWRVFRFPTECFYTLGKPKGWTHMATAQVVLPTGARIRNIRLVKRECVRGPRMTDQALIAALDLDRPGLEAARSAASPQAMLAEIARYFRSSTYDRKHVVDEGSQKANLAEADRVLEGYMMGQHWPKGVDWDANPYGYIEWSIRIHNFPFFKPLQLAWAETKNPKYVAAMEAMMCDWMARTPVPFGVRAGGLAWGHSLIVSHRAFCILVDIFGIFCAWGAVKDQTLIDLLKSMYEHVVYLLQFESFPPSNKTISEGRAVLAMACSFPEFRESPAWYEAASRRLLDDMTIQVLPDGASYELTPGYQMAIASWFLDGYRVAQKFGRELPPELEAGIRRMYDWCVSITRPDFSRPSVSDAGGLDAKFGESLARPGRFLHNAEATWVGTEGKEGSPPEYTSVARPDSGYFVMRSGWQKEDLFLLFEGGPFGRFHQHEDMLSFDLYAHGIPFIVDPGIASYYPNPWTTYYRTTRAHNTVLVDGCGQHRRIQTIEEWVAPARNRTVWRSDERSDVAVATFDAKWEGLEAAVVHRRAVMFVKPGYFLVFDELTGEGSHVYEALFHFMPYRVLIDPVTGAVRTGRMNPPNLEIVPLTRMTPKVVCGQNDPVQGWLAIGGQDVPAPVAMFRKRARLPYRTGYILAPFVDGVTAGITKKVVRRGEKWSIQITRADGSSDRVTMDWASSQGPVLG